jgi:hypothetical protein
VKDTKTAEFNAELTPNGRIDVPPEIAAQVPSGQKVQVVLQWGVSDDDAPAWRGAGRRSFEGAYADDDSVYESLIHDPSSR